MCGYIGHLMQGSGLEIVIGAAFGRVSRMMDHGKPWVRALRAFRMVSSILLQSFLQTGFKTWEDICEYLETARLGRQPHNPNLARTPRLGYEVVYPVATSWIKPCPLQRERERERERERGGGEWLLYQLCNKRLLPYIFIAGHHNYARCRGQRRHSLRSQVVYSKQPKLGLTQEFVVLLVRMRLVVCMFVCLFVCYNLFVCFTGNLGDWVLGRGGSLLLLEKLWDFLLQ